MKERNDGSALFFLVLVYGILLLFIANSCMNTASNELGQFKLKTLDEMIDGTYQVP